MHSTETNPQQAAVSPNAAHHNLSLHIVESGSRPANQQPLLTVTSTLALIPLPLLNFRTEPATTYQDVLHTLQHLPERVCLFLACSFLRASLCVLSRPFWHSCFCRCADLNLGTEPKGGGVSI